MLYLHVGIHKTGSSAVQHFCYHNQEALAGVDLHYSQMGLRPRSGQHDLAFCFRKPPLPANEQQGDWRSYLPGLLDEIKKHKNVVISSEVFCKGDQEKISQFKDALSEWTEIKVILYFRNLWDHAIASYGQHIKSGQTSASAEEFNWNGLANLDYRLTIQRWQALFGSDQVIVRSYDRAMSRDGTIIPDFLKCLEISTELALAHRKQQVNVTPHWDILEYLRLWNKISWQPKLHVKLGAFSELLQKKDAAEQNQYLPQSLYQVLREYASASAWVEWNFSNSKDPFFRKRDLVTMQYPGLSQQRLSKINEYLYYKENQVFKELSSVLRDIDELNSGSAARLMRASFLRLEQVQTRRPRPFFSVLVPAYNRADVLHYAIQSALQQSFTDFELLVVGDGCTDHTEEVVRSFEDDRILYIDMPKAAGYGHENRNVALRSALGKYVAILAHDNLWLSDHLSTFHREIVEHENLDILFSRPCWVDPQGAIFPTNYNLHLASVFSRFSQGKANGIPATNVVYKRALHEQVGWWNAAATRPADHDLWARILSTGGVTHSFINKLTCLHFRANWRTDQNSEPGDLAKYRTLYSQSESVPAVFQAKEIPKGITEQEYIYSNFVVRQDFSRELNSSMLDLYDQVLLTYLRSLADKDICTDIIDIGNFSKRKEMAPAHLDRINGRSSRAFKLQENESTLHLEGWGFDPLSQSVGSMIVVQVNERFYQADQYGILRNDVARHFELPAVRHSGFSSTIVMDKKVTSHFQIRLWVISRTKTDVFPTAVSIIFQAITSP